MLLILFCYYYATEEHDQDGLTPPPAPVSVLPGGIQEEENVEIKIQFAVGLN